MRFQADINALMKCKCVILTLLPILLLHAREGETYSSNLLEQLDKRFNPSTLTIRLLRLITGVNNHKNRRKAKKTS